MISLQATNMFPVLLFPSLLLPIAQGYIRNGGFHRKTVNGTEWDGVLMAEAIELGAR